MSLIPIGLTVLAASLEGLLNPVLIRPRSIGPFIADITVEEMHVDRLVSTEHPVEQGAAISDHAYKKPSQVTIRAGWSNSSIQAAGNPVYINQIYAALLALQASRELIDILTGKRFYQNMLIEGLTTRTDKDFENAMMLTCECKELILTSTQTVSVPNSSDMKSPEVNAPTQNTGTKALGPAPSFNFAAQPTDL